jgi:hypothetical protein
MGRSVSLPTREGIAMKMIDAEYFVAVLFVWICALAAETALM